MKFIKWKGLIITCLVCLSPILLGMYLWNDLSESVAIHFNLNNEADNFVSREFAVFGLPILMVLFQIVCCIASDLNVRKHGRQTKLETLTKWILPVITVILQIITLGYNLGWNIDIRKSVALITGIMFIVTGNYLPKLDYVKNYNLDTEKARKINRFAGYEAVIMGVLMLITIFLPPVATAVWLVLLIPYTIISVIYAVKVGRKTD